MAENKTKANDQSVLAFLENVQDAQKREDCFTLLRLMEEITGKPAKMWGDTMVGFDQYHYKYATGREGDSLLTGFSPRKQNLTIYITAGFEGYEPLLGKLGRHSIGKSCLYVKSLKDVDMAVLREMVQRSVDHMRKMYPAG
jgi:hypothetical protein